MDTGFHSPLFDCFRRGEVAAEVRLLAARGALAPRAHEQVALLLWLIDDSDPEVRRAAESTISLIPREPLAAFLARPDVSDSVRAFFSARGVEVASAAATDPDAPLVEEDSAAETGDAEASKQNPVQRLAMMSIVGRMQAAMKGTREERAILIRDPNKLVSVSVLSSPKVNESEIESFAKMANVSEEVLRIIGTTRAWIKNYGVVSSLCRNPKTPLGISLHLVQRLNDRDLKMLALDRNMQEALRVAVRKRIAGGAG
jgi:hypothetical protein